MARRGKKSNNERQGGGIRQLPWRDIVNSYPPLDPAIDEELSDFVARRRQALL